MLNSVLISSGAGNVVACSETDLFLRANESIVVGSKVVVLPGAGEELCQDCNSLARRIVAIEPATEFLGIPCPLDSVQGCLNVTTELLLLSELLDSATIIDFELQDVANETVEFFFGCVILRKRSVSDFDNLDSEEALMALEHRALVKRQPMADVCTDLFTGVDADGRCVSTDCFVGTTGDPQNCLSCKTECYNGCGVDGANALVRAISTSIPGVFDFASPCCFHDKCYSTKTSQAQCDKEFFKQTLDTCVASTPFRFFFRSRFLPLPTAVLSLVDCPALALGYYLIVAIKGKAAFDKAQQDQRAYEATTACAATCPTTQSSGGQGTTTLTVDVLANQGSFPVVYNMFGIPDQLEIFYEGSLVFTTGGLVSGSQSVGVSFGPGTSTFVQVVLTAPLDDTAWTLAVGCALEPP